MDKLKICIFLYATLLSAHGLEENLQEIYPILFKENTNDFYLYTNVISRTFEQKDFINEEILEQTIIQTFQPLLSSNTTTKPNITNIVISELRNLLFDIRNLHRPPKVVKREFGKAVGGLLKEWFDVALMEDIHLLSDNDYQLSQAILNVQNVIKTEHDNLIKLESSFNKFSLTIYESFQILSSTINSQNQIFLLLHQLRDIYTSCNQHIIPSSIITPDTLSRNLLDIQSQVSNYNLELAIPPSHSQPYYILKLAQCSLQDDIYSIRLRLLLKPLHSTFQIFKPIFLPFTNNLNQICSITAEKSYIITDTASQNTYVISEAYLHKCEYTNHLCKLNMIPKSSIHSLCLQAAFKNNNISQLSRLCPLTCIPSPDNSPLINPIEANHYILTNIPSNLYVEYLNNSISHINVPTSRLGTYTLHLPCGAQLLQTFNINSFSSTSRILIPKSHLCNNSTATLSLTSIFSWSNTSLFQPSLYKLWDNFTTTSFFLSSDEFNASINKIHKLHTFQSSLVLPLAISERINLFFELFAIINTFYIFYTFSKIKRRIRKLTQDIPLQNRDPPPPYSP